MLLFELLEEDIEDTELRELLLELEEFGDELTLDAEDRDVEDIEELFHQPPLPWPFPLSPKTAARTHLRKA